MAIQQSVLTALSSVAKAFTPSTAAKPWWQSKTLWTTVILAGAAFYPPVDVIVAANPALAGVVVSAIFGFLRIVTGGKVTLSSTPAVTVAPDATSQIPKP